MRSGGEVVDEMRKTDKLFLILHRAGWSIDCTAFAGKEGLSWLVYGTNSNYSIQANGKTQEEAWKQACRQAEEMRLVQPVMVFVTAARLLLPASESH